jgi:hypothetical protein
VKGGNHGRKESSEYSSSSPSLSLSPPLSLSLPPLSFSLSLPPSKRLIEKRCGDMLAQYKMFDKDRGGSYSWDELVLVLHLINHTASLLLDYSPTVSSPVDLGH